MCASCCNHCIKSIFVFRTFVTMVVFLCTFLIVSVVFLLVVAEKCRVSVASSLLLTPKACHFPGVLQHLELRP